MDKNRQRLLELVKQISEEKKKNLGNNELLETLTSEYEILKNHIKEQQKREIIKGFKTMKPFKNILDIPSVPVVDEKTYNEIIIPNLIRCGAIPKKDLIVGKIYIGDCRNATEAIWKGNVFTYKRYKFGTYFDEDINHFEDDNGYDVFVPIRVKEEN